MPERVAKKPSSLGEAAIAAATVLPCVAPPESGESQVAPSPAGPTTITECTLRCAGPIGPAIVVTWVAVCEKFGVSRLMPLSTTVTIWGGTASVPLLMRRPSALVSMPPPSTPAWSNGRMKLESSADPAWMVGTFSALNSIMSRTGSIRSTRSSRASLSKAFGCTRRRIWPPNSASLTSEIPWIDERLRATADVSEPGTRVTTAWMLSLVAFALLISGRPPKSVANLQIGW